MITIEKLDPSRWKEYKNLRLEALEKDDFAFGTSYDEAANDSDEEWKERLENSFLEKDFITLFALDEGKPIGMMTAYWSDKIRMKHVANVVGVYVDETYRGQGIGIKILNSLIEKIRDKKQFKKIRLQVAALNLPARKLYEKVGFKGVGVLKEELYVNGRYYDDVLMELYL